MKNLFKVMVLAGFLVFVIRGTAVCADRADTSFVDSSGSQVSSYTIPYNANTSAVVYLESDCGQYHYTAANFCNSPAAFDSTSSRVTVTGATYADQANTSLGRITNPSIYRTTDALTLRLNPNDSAPATGNNSTLDVDGGPASATIGLEGQHDSKNALHADLTPVTFTLLFADYNGTLVVRVNDTSYGSGDELVFADGDTVNVRVTDYDENYLGYSAQTLTNALVIKSSVDTVTVSPVESGSNTGLFDISFTVATYDGSADSSDTVLEVAVAGETNITVTYTDPDTGHDDSGTDTASASAAITSASVIQNFLVEADSPQTAGTAFTVTITARDSGGSTLTGYAGTVTPSTNYISPGSGTSVVTPIDDITSFVSGVATINNATYADAGTITITATDADTNTGTSDSILVLPDNFLVASTAGLSQVVNKAFEIRVTARNSGNVTTPNYNTSVNLTLSNATPAGTTVTISPTSISGSSFASGIAAVNLTYNKWGTAKITATDSGNSNATGITASSINFYPNSFTITTESPPASRSKFYLEELFDVTVTALDYNGDTITNYGGEVTFTDVDDIDLPDDYSFSSADEGVKAFTVSGTEEKDFTLTVSDKNYAGAIGTSDDISLMYGKIKVNNAVGPIGTITTTVEILDSDGQVIAEDDSTTFVLTTTESISNSSASLVDLNLDVSGGTANISLTDTEAETVSVYPDSFPYLDPELGEITFSESATDTTGGGAQRIGAGGRVLFWRELRSDEAR